MPTSNSKHRSSNTRRRGFTLIEAALTTVIIGTGVLAIVAAQQAYHQKNNWAQRTNTAMLLANELRERTVRMPLRDPAGGTGMGPEADEFTSSGEPDVRLFNDLDDFADPDESTTIFGRTTFSPPINAMGLPVPDMDGWSQQITIARIDSRNINVPDSFLTTPLATTTDMMRATVEVSFEDQTITTLSWIVPAR